MNKPLKLSQSPQEYLLRLIASLAVPISASPSAIISSPISRVASISIISIASLCRRWSSGSDRWTRTWFNSATSWIQVASQFSRNGLKVHEIAETWPSAFSHLVLATASLSEICNWWEFCVNWSTTKPAVVEIFSGTVSILFTTELKKRLNSLKKVYK